jgi:putative endonuclease
METLSLTPETDSNPVPTSYTIGLHAEEAVMQLLLRSGWSVLSHRCRTRWGEIDIVARRGGLLTFIEVKAAGPRRLDPLRVVDEKSQHRLRKAAVAWIATHHELQRNVESFRFDVAIVRYDEDRRLRGIERIPNAF